MALRFLEGFDHYASGAAAIGTHEYGQRWTAYSAFGGGTGCNGSIVTGRFGNGYQGSASNCEFWLSKTLDDQATWIVGWAFKTAGLSSPSGIFRLDDSGGTTQISLYPGGDGSLNLYRGDGSVLLASAPPGTILSNIWYYLEVKATINNSGTAVVRINGVEVINVSTDTQNSANANARTILFGGDRTQTGTTTIDDVYIMDGTGSAPYTDFLGDIRVETLYPNGNGSTSALDGSDGNTTDNYLLVDESNGNDGDTTYVESADVADKDTYAYGNLSSATGTVYAVQPLLKVRKTDAGSRSVASVARLNAGTEADSSNHSLGNSYAIYSDIRTAKPGGGSWSISDVNDGQFGMKVTV